MQYSIQRYLLLGFVTLVIVGVLTPVMRSIAMKVGAFDAPNMSRKIQKEPVPYLGGIAISIGVVVVSYSALLYADNSMHTFALASTVLLPAIAISAMGLFDDLKGLEPWPRLAAQTGAGLIVSLALISTNTLGTPFNNILIDGIVTTLWIVGVCNSINFFDNLDGGAAGTVAIISIFLFLIAFDSNQLLISAMAIVTAGATIGFLFWNRAPAKIYMGDAGALFLGVIISVMTIRLDPKLLSRELAVAVPLALMAVPIMDTTVAVCSRIKRGISPFEGGRDHLSHRLMRIGFGRRRTALALWSLTAIFGADAYVIYKWPIQFGFPFAAYGAFLWVLLLILFFWIPSTD